MRFCTYLLLLIITCGCAINPLRPPREEWPEIGNEFAKALRWGGRDLGATFFTNDSRPDFLAAYSDGDALQIINARHEAVGPPQEGNARGILFLEYYRSPSVSVKKANIPLEWSCFEAGSLLPCHWQITSLLTRLP